MSTPTPMPSNFTDLASLTAWLTEHCPGFQAPILQMEPLGGGQSNPTYCIQTAHAQWVMRTKPAKASQLLKSAHAIEREYRVMRALSGSEIAVPEVHALCEDESIIGMAFFIMQHVPGRVFMAQELPTLDKKARHLVYQEMNRLLARLHAQDVKRLGLEDFGRAGNYFERQIRRWSEQYENSITQEIDEMRWLMQWLPHHLPDSAQVDFNCLVHGDYRLDNLIFEPEHWRVAALVDWELSTLGHPLADFSYHCMSWHITPALFRGIAGLDLAQLGIPQEAQYIQWYCENSGLFEPRELARDWPFYLAYNLFRMASILQGIAKRRELGTASSPQALEAAKAARPMAQLAWHMAQRASV